MITVQLIGDKELVARLDAMPARVHEGLVRAVTRLGFELQRKVQAEKLTGQVLKVRTGSLRSSINTQVTETATEVAASVGTNVSYSRIHEYGVPHPWIIEAKRAKALRFEIGGETIFRRRVTHPPLPERSFLRSALREMVPTIEAGLRDAVTQAIHA